jgi:N-formylglutamate amidohydrolase
MPASTASPRHKTIGFAGYQGKPVDFCLGDRDGTTCPPAFTRAISNFLENMGYSVAINDPFKGVTLIRQYAAPALGRHALQIEINKSLYMNEETGKKNKNFEKIQSDISRIAEFITNHAQSLLTPLAAD